MALLFCDSFDHYATAHLFLKGWSVSGSEVTIDNTGGREGGQALRLAAGSGVTARRDVPSKQVLHVGAALYLSSLPASAFPLLTFLDGESVQCVLEWNADGTVTMKRGTTVLATSTETLPVAGFGYLEVRVLIDSANGSFTVRRNEATILSDSGINTQETGNATVDGLRWQAMTDSGEHVRVDDFYVTDNAGSLNNTFLGDVEIQALYPNADGQMNDFEGPETDRYTVLAESPLNENSTLHSTEGNHVETSVFEALSESVVTVLAVQSVAAFRRTGSAQAWAAAMAYDTNNDILIKSPIFEARSDTIFLWHVYDDNPSEGTLWDKENLTPFEFGLQHALEEEEGSGGGTGGGESGSPPSN